MAEKRYYWMRLDENFFDEKHIKFLRKLPDGDKVVIVYLKMQLKSLKTEGFIKIDAILPSNIEELALILDEDIEIVKFTIEALKQLNLIELLEDGYYMTALQSLIGREGSSAERVRRFREARKNQEALQCNGDVTTCNAPVTKVLRRDRERYRYR